MRFPVLSKNKILEKGYGFESLRFLISHWTMLRLPPSLVCQTCEWEPHMSKPRRSTEILARSRFPKSDTKNRAGAGGERGSRFRPFHFRLACLMDHFRVPPGLCFKARVGAQPLIWKSFFILMQIKLIFTRKVVHLASFWKWGFFGTQKWPIFATSLLSEILAQAT